MSNYNRVLPRDFFNEAKLLKCFGFLSLAILDSKINFVEMSETIDDGENFNIVLMDEGSLTISNIETSINGVTVIFKTTYNSKANFPFFCDYQNNDIQVFDETGEFTGEFLELKNL